MLKSLAIPALLIAVTTGLVACGKEDKNSEAASSELRKDDAAAAEAEKRSSMMADLVTEQQFLDLKIKAAAERLENQGNKTKKKWFYRPSCGRIFRPPQWNRMAMRKFSKLRNPRAADLMS